MKATGYLFSIFGIFLFCLPLAAQEPKVPDFSKGMTDVTLERKSKFDGQETFSLKTTLSLESFSDALSKFLGPDWQKRKREPEELKAATSLGLTSIANIDFSIYKNTKFDGVEIHVLYAEYEQQGMNARVEILIERTGALINDFGTFISPDGSKQLKVMPRDGDIVDFEVIDVASGKKLASDSIGWSAMRWFLHWENSARLWGYGSDISYFKRYEFKSDGTVEEIQIAEQSAVPAAVWDGLPLSLKKNHKKEETASFQVPAPSPSKSSK